MISLWLIQESIDTRRLRCVILRQDGNTLALRRSKPISIIVTLNGRDVSDEQLSLKPRNYIALPKRYNGLKLCVESVSFCQCVMSYWQ